MKYSQNPCVHSVCFFELNGAIRSIFGSTLDAKIGKAYITAMDWILARTIFSPTRLDSPRLFSTHFGKTNSETYGGIATLMGFS